MAETFDLTELIRIFRSGLLALLPVMDAARIRWSEPGVYDDWENIQRTLFTSIVGSCVENAVPGGLKPLTLYGLTYERYDCWTFVSERGLRIDGKMNCFLGLQTTSEPFDTALLRVVGADLFPTGEIITRPIARCEFDLGRRLAADVEYMDRVTYEE